MEKPILKTFSLRVRSEKDVKLLGDFHKVAVKDGKGVQETVLEMMRNFVKFHKPGDVTLVTERELLERSKKLGFTAVHGTIKSYRRDGVLKDDEGPFYFSNKDGKIVYVWEKMKAFLKQRAKDPYSRLNREANG